MPTHEGHGRYWELGTDRINSECWQELVSAIAHYGSDDSFALSYPLKCVNPGEAKATSAIFGADRDALFKDVLAHGLPMPSQESAATYLSEVLNLIRFLDRRVARAEKAEYHNSQQHYHLSFDKEAGRTAFRRTINSIFERHRITLGIDDTGHVTRIPSVEAPLSTAAEPAHRDHVERAKYPTAFVSHSTQDRAFVEHLATDLRANGVDAWYSGWEIKPGDSIRAKIEEGLEGCEYFVIVLSKNSISRPWVQTELDAATIRKLNGKVRKIIPVKIEDCGELPPTLSSLCWEDFSIQPYESGLRRVLDSIFDVDLKPRLGPPPTVSTSDLVKFQITTLSGEPELVPELPKKASPSTNFPIHMNALGRFVSDLRREGFDARSDLFNGQVGLIVGPKGLDGNRMKPGDAAFFLPLWELNFEANRSLVAERRFHDIVEARPSDWEFNRPYRDSQAGGHHAKPSDSTPRPGEPFS
jgi:hypothetical protein